MCSTASGVICIQKYLFDVFKVNIFECILHIKDGSRQMTISFINCPINMNLAWYIENLV